jgi:hypothetical protein
MTSLNLSRLNFKNHPSIATKLVKFLAINTSFEAIKKLTSQVAYHQLKICDCKKSMAAATKSAASSRQTRPKLFNTSLM